MELKNLGSLITYEHGDHEHCLGYLWHAAGHGTFDPSLGKVDVSKEHADTHNRLLDEAMLKGLDDSCEVGMGGSFYTSKNEGRTVIKTFMGTLVSADVSIRNGKINRLTGNPVTTLTFRRKGKVYRGRVNHAHDLFNFRRVA